MTDKDDKSLKKADISLWKAMTKDVEGIPDKIYIDGIEESVERDEAHMSQTKDAAQGSGFPIETSVDLSKKRALSAAPSKEIDRRTSERLRRGQIPIEGTIDLHGMTRMRAEDALTAFIRSAHVRGQRCVLVITGKGSLSRPSVIRRDVPIWLSSGALGAIVLKHQTAQPKHGGAGAMYVYLRRSRDDR